MSEQLYVSPEKLAYVYNKLKSEFEERIAALEARLGDVSETPAEEAEF